MNLWLSLFLPIAFINIVLRLFQYGFNREFKDKYIIAIIISITFAVSVVIVTMGINGYTFQFWSLLIVILGILTAFIQASFDDKQFTRVISKESSLTICTILSSLAIYLIMVFMIL